MSKLFKRRIEAIVFLVIFLSFFGFLSYQMGIKNLLSTVMNTSHDLLLNTVFYLLSIMVLASALGDLMIEFGVVRLFEKLLAPLMRPLYNLPGVASLVGLMTFFSDNPAIISFAKDEHYNSYFRKHELLSLTNFGTSFGMGLIVVTFMIGQNFFTAAMVGLVGAIIGSIISTRLMQLFLKGKLDDEDFDSSKANEDEISLKHDKTLFLRFIDSILDGGKKGVELGLAIIPGVLIISTIVMIITYGPKDPSAGYQGLAYEGYPLLPMIADKFSFIFKFLFGFENGEAVAFPITSLGSVGAALSLIPSFLERGIIGGNEIAVFTAIGMCWSGYLSTHTAMLDSLNYRQFTSKALIAHTVGGLFAGIFAHYIYLIFA